MAVSASIRRLFDSTAQRLGLRRAVGLLQSSIISAPVVVGWLRPVVLLPASVVTGLSQGQLQAIMAHELAHVRRHDYLINILQTVLEAAFFFPDIFGVHWMACRSDQRVLFAVEVSTHSQRVLVVGRVKEANHQPNLSVVRNDE